MVLTLLLLVLDVLLDVVVMVANLCWPLLGFARRWIRAYEAKDACGCEYQA